jgi:acetylornithine/succinyldiaminopimelate/putrescine aminotransferase
LASVLEQLDALRSAAGERRTVGLSDDTVCSFCQHDSTLVDAVEAATAEYEALSEEFPELVGMGEMEQIRSIQGSFVNFYSDDTVNPYVSLAARGPWVVTTKGAVVHDSGGYGMLGFGHVPEPVLKAMSRPQVMANVMTANASQLRLVRALQKEIGQARAGGCPFSDFLAMNSGSEAVSVATRILDINAKLQTDVGARYAGLPVKKLVLEGSFHGRTGRAAEFSHATRPTYEKHLATFRGSDDLLAVPINDTSALRLAFERANSAGFFIEAMLIEPVMGEGNPGVAVTPEFYEVARESTTPHDTLLVVDSIQAGLRATGYLSIVDFPGFEELAAPDMETYSKALNGGQFPLSVLAMTRRASGLYRKGVYGNTMTANPRAMDVGAAVLGIVTPEVRANIVDRGHEFLEKLEALAAELDGPITAVQGTGLLFSCELDPKYKAYGKDSAEEYMRFNGIGVIHGGENSLRFTPHFHVTSAEVDLIVAQLRDAMLNGPRAS